MAVPFQDVVSTFRYLASFESSRVATAVAEALVKDHKSLLELSVNARDYSVASDFRADYLLVEALSKYKGLDTGIDTEAEALSRFRLAEDRCRDANRRLSGQTHSPLSECAGTVFRRAQRKISMILGPLNALSVLSHCRWTTGASSSIRRRDAGVDKKMTSLPITCTRRAWPYLKRELECDPVWFECLAGTYPSGPYSVLGKHVVEVREWNKVQVVPKNAKTGRVIAAENTGNMFLQKSIGQYLRDRLRRFGVDLSDQSINQRMAKAAYDWGYTTIDMKMASDTTAVECVYALLPVDWALLLDDLRSPYGKLPDGEVIRYSKFSSMGNAYTFELETLIFAGVAFAISEEFEDPRPSFVYGDDVIIPNEWVAVFKETVEYLGYLFNEDKTHGSDTPFRESCGAHFFRGEEVTPFYQKEVVTDDFEAIRFANRLFRYADSAGYYPALAAREAFLSVWPVFRYSVPEGIDGDDGLIVEDWRFEPLKIDRNRGFKVRVLRKKPKRRLANQHALYAYALRVLANTLNFEDEVGTSLSHLPARAVNNDTQWVDVNAYSYVDSYRWVIPTSWSPDLR